MLAHKNQYEINPNQELWGLGMANLAGACFGAYPSTGKTASTNNTNIKGQASCINSINSALMCVIIISTDGAAPHQPMHRLFPTA